MNKLTISVLVIACIHMCSHTYAQVAINTDESEPDASSILDLSSSEKGFLLPRMSSTQRDNITDPATGLMVYVTDNDNIYIYEGSSWIEGIGGANSGWEVIGNDIVTTESGNVGIGTTTPTNQLEMANAGSGDFENTSQQLSLYSDGSDAYLRTAYLRSHSPTMGDKTSAAAVTQDGDNLGQVRFNGVRVNGGGGSVSSAGWCEIIQKGAATEDGVPGQFQITTASGIAGGRDTRMVVSPQGYVGIGTTTPTNQLEIAKAGSSISEHTTMRLYLYSDGSIACPILNFARSHSPTMGDNSSASAVTQDGDILGRMVFSGVRVNGSGGSAWGAGWAEMIQKGATTENGVPGQFQITTSDGTGGRDTRFVVSPTGKVGIGTTTPSELLDIEGNIDLNGNQIKNMVIENRTSDPSSPPVGQIWLRTDL